MSTNVSIQSDRLSPILVKELRQAIRSNLFTGAFLLIQVILFFFGFALVSSESMRQDPSVGTALFWGALALPLLLVVPATASQSIEREISARTLELLLLTRLSAYRIVLGKWMSAVVQCALILSTVLPYVMLRYFLGGVDLWLELEVVLGLFLGSAILAGIAMGFWSVSVSRWAKVGVVILSLWLGPWVLALFFMPHGGIGTVPGGGILAWVYAAVFMLMMLEHAASRIAPPAENHATRVRLLALFGLLGAFLFARVNDEVAAMMALALALPAVIVALNEPLQPVARLYAPFLRGSGLWRAAAFPLCPGWPGGVAFGTLVALIVPFVPALRPDMTLYLWLALVATFALPAAVLRALLPARMQKTGFYLLLLMLSTVPVYLWAFARGLGLGSLDSTLSTVAGFCPPLALTLEIDAPGGYPTEVVVRPALALVAGVSAFVLWRGALRSREAMKTLTRAPSAPATAGGEAEAEAEAVALAG